MIRKNGILYRDFIEVERMAQSPEGQERLRKNPFQQVRWSKFNGYGQNRRQRRHAVKPFMFGEPRNNAQDRTKHKDW
jgi:hypothetical protein